MAIVQKTPKRVPEIRDFWRIHRGRSIAAVIGVQFFASLAITGGLFLFNILTDIPAVLVAFFAIFFALTGLNLAATLLLLTPLCHISTAIANAAGQKIDKALPNPSKDAYKKTGLSDILLFIYGNSSKEEPTDEDTPRLDLATILNQTSAGVVALNKDNSIVFANRAAPVKYPAGEKPQLALIFEEEDIYAWLDQVKQTEVHAQKTWLRVANKYVGEEDRRIFNVTANFEQGREIETVIVMYDETALYQPEDDDLDFIAFAAHELRGPITVIRGYLDVLLLELQDKLQPDQMELFRRLIVSGNRLSGYINNILNTSRYDRRHLKLQLVEDSVANIYASIKDDMELRAQSQRRSLTVNIPADLPTVAVDRSSISEVISNLIDNAIKYSNEGGSVQVSAEATENFVNISVADNGIGMPANVVNNLFHKFYRSHRSRETVAGTGIGLYLCKAIIESHGGTISVSSTEGAGSTFTFSVPIYAKIADKLKDNNTNDDLIASRHGWIKNHSKYMG